MGRTLKQKTPKPPTAQDYDEQERRLAERGDLRTHRPSTERLLADEWCKWEQYCLYRGYGDPLQALREISDPAWPIYLDWRCANSPFEGHCVSTVNGWFKRLCGNYLAKVSRAGASAQARAQVQLALGEGGWLVRKYNLNTEGMDKEVVNFDDFVESISTLFRAPPTTLYFKTEQQRARTWMFELFLGCSGMRPGAFVDNSRGQEERRPADEVGEFDAVVSIQNLPRYKDCKLTQFPAEDGGRHGDWVLELQVRHVKGGVKSGEKPVTHLIHQNPCLALCPIMAFLQMAFADGAFEAKDLTPAGFFDLQVPPGAPCLPVTFKPSILETPLFRDDNGDVLRYEAMRVLLARLGDATGFEHGLRPYDFRRGVANAIHGKTTTAIQNKALHHSSIVIFERFYQNRRLQLDVQNTFMGIPGNDRLLKLASAMGRTRDPRRPTTINEDDLRQANESEDVRALEKARAEALGQCQEKFGSAMAAKGSVEHKKYSAAAGRVGSARRRLAREALKDRRARHDERVAVEDVEQQLRGSMPAVRPPLSDGHLLPTSLRGRIVAQLFAAEMPMPNTSEDAARRASALTDLVELYTLEAPHHKRRTVTGICTNCATDTTPQWRYGDTGLLCAACCHYRHKYGRPRPHEVIAKGQHRASGRRCGNAACAADTSPRWYFIPGGSLCASNRATDAKNPWTTEADMVWACGTCYQYYQRHKRHRSRELVLRAQSLAQYKGQPRRCANEACASADTTKDLVRTPTHDGILRLCHSCYSYYQYHKRLRSREQVLRARSIALYKGQPRKCSNEACAATRAWHWYRTENGLVCGPCHRYRQRNNRHRPHDVVVQSNNREPSRADQLRPTQSDKSTGLIVLQWHPQHGDLKSASAPRPELPPLCGSPPPASSSAVSQESFQMPLPWPDDPGLSGTPLSLPERSPDGSPGRCFTDLLYSDTIEDLRLAGFDPIREASDGQPDDFNIVDNPGDSLLDEFDFVEKASNTCWQIDDGLVAEVSDTDTVPQDCHMDDLRGDGVRAWPWPTQLPGSACLFCYFEAKLGEDRQRISVFTARSSMQRHAENTHFREMRERQSWVCPDGACHGMSFKNAEHLKNHAATVHLVLFAVTATTQDQTGG